MMATLQVKVKINCGRYSCGACKFVSKVKTQVFKCLLFHEHLKLRLIRNRGVSYHRAQVCIDAQVLPSPILAEVRQQVLSK
jgi:hypothetical protein